MFISVSLHWLGPFKCLILIMQNHVTFTYTYTQTQPFIVKDVVSPTRLLAFDLSHLLFQVSDFFITAAWFNRMQSELSCAWWAWAGIRGDYTLILMMVTFDIILTQVLRLEDILPADNVTYDKNKPPTFRQVLARSSWECHKFCVFQCQAQNTYEIWPSPDPHLTTWPPSDLPLNHT